MNSKKVYIGQGIFATIYPHSRRVSLKEPISGREIMIDFSSVQILEAYVQSVQGKTNA